MKVPAVGYVTIGVGLMLAGIIPGSAAAQVPTVEPREPRVAAPARGAVIQTAPPTEPATPGAAPTEAATPAAQPADQPAAAPAAAEPAPVTAVTGPAPGVTTIPAPSGATASSSYAAMADHRGYTAGKYALTLEGVQVGWMRSVEGGSATSDVVLEKLGPDHITKKHLAGVKYEDISVKTGLDSKLLDDWIAQTLKGGPSRKDGSIVAANFDYKPMSELQFSQALITEVTFPTLDAGSKDAGVITVKITPETTRLQKGSGSLPTGTTGTKDPLQKKWLASNFRFQLDGLESATARVGHIESFTVSLQVVGHPVGELRDYEKTQAQLEFPDLKLSFSAADADSWVQWHDDFVIKGNNTDDKEKNGSIVYFGAGMTTELGRVKLFNCGIVRLGPQKAEAGGEQIQRFDAELYCERMEFEAKAAAH